MQRQIAGGSRVPPSPHRRGTKYRKRKAPQFRAGYTSKHCGAGCSTEVVNVLPLTHQTVLLLVDNRAGCQQLWSYVVVRCIWVQQLAKPIPSPHNVLEFETVQTCSLSAPQVP